MKFGFLVSSLQLMQRLKAAVNTVKKKGICQRLDLLTWSYEISKNKRIMIVDRYASLHEVQDKSNKQIKVLKAQKMAICSERSANLPKTRTYKSCTGICTYLTLSLAALLHILYKSQKAKDNSLLVFASTRVKSFLDRAHYLRQHIKAKQKSGRNLNIKWFTLFTSETPARRRAKPDAVLAVHP